MDVSLKVFLRTPDLDEHLFVEVLGNERNLSGETRTGEEWMVKSPFILFFQRDFKGMLVYSLSSAITSFRKKLKFFIFLKAFPKKTFMSLLQIWFRTYKCSYLYF